MSSQAYVGASKRTFQQAFIHEMETHYGFLKSRRLLTLMDQDIQALIQQFYPAADHLQPGWVVFTGTKAEGSKAYPGQESCDQTLVTLAWPLLTPQDLEWMSTHPDTKEARWQLLTQRAIRLIEHGWSHPDGPVLLTLADLSLLLGLTTVEVSQLLKEARQQTDKPLLTKGYFFDQGMRPTHKTEIIQLYEQGYDETDIARLSHHDQTSVGRYIRDYERVRQLIQHDILPDQICRLLDMSPGLVKAYSELVRLYHPESETSSTPVPDST